jgi:DNA recombination protein RmuC
MITLLLTTTLVIALSGLILIVLVWQKLKQPVGESLDQALREELRQSREEASNQARELRQEVADGQANANAVLVQTVNTLGENQQSLLEHLTKATNEGAAATRAEIEKLVQRTDEGLKQIQKNNDDRMDQVRRTLDEKLRQMMDGQKNQLTEVVTALKGLEKTHQDGQQKALEKLDQKFQQIQESNEKKLDQMRQTVDEKLQSTLEKRLGESFKQVSERLEAVQHGLGEMKQLATGVGDLQRVLTNVKERGTWGEYQLGAILEQILTPEQYGRNVHVQEGRETVEFAIKLPGKGVDQDKPVWLPIDSKFPKEDYERLMAASTTADAKGVEQATNALLGQVSSMAKDIQNKYIAVPHTTDFGILFLPTEGLYAEVLRQPGFHDELQRKYRVMVAGPTTLSAILSSLRVGFQTLAIEQRAHEVWTVLGAVRTEFGRFGEVLATVKKQLNTAANTLEKTSVRTRAMERTLRDVTKLPADKAAAVFDLTEAVSSVEAEEDAGEESSEK